MEVRGRELERFSRKLADLEPDHAEAVEELTRGIIQKILHQPTRYLKNIGDRGDASRYAAIYREMFDLPDEEPEEECDDSHTAARGD